MLSLSTAAAAFPESHAVYNAVEDLLTLADIGREYGVTRQAVTKWAKREDFPTPHGQTGSGRVWKRKDVERWARKTGRLR